MNKNTHKKITSRIGKFISFGFFLLTAFLLMIIANFSTRLLSICLIFLIPTMVAIVFDGSEDKCLSLSVGLCNLSGIMTYGPQALLFSMNSSMAFFAESLPKASDIALVYGFSAIGFLVHSLVPDLTRLIYMHSIKSRRENSKKKISLYKSKWDVQ